MVWQRAVVGLLSTVGLGAKEEAKEEPDPKIFRKKDRKPFFVSSFLTDVANDGQWLVAWEDGDYELVVGELRVSLAVVSEEEIEVVLSHRWSPILQTTMGPMPTGFFRESFKKRTWVDFVNHFNIPEYALRVVGEMGALYLKTRCRALYLELEEGEGDSEQSFEAMAAAVARAWMWQELSLGPQDHQYVNPSAVLLHCVVMVGELSADVRFGSLRECSDAVLERASGAESLSSALADALGEEGFTESEALVSAVSKELESAATVKEAVREASKMLQWIGLEGRRCAAAVFQQRNIPDPSLQTAFSGGGMTFISVANAFGAQRPASVKIWQAAKDMLVAACGDREASQLASSTMNLCNFNVTKPEDRLVASFGVVCARREVACAVPEVSAMIRDAGLVYAVCLAGSKAFGVGAVTARQVEVRRSEVDADAAEKVGNAVVGAVGGALLSAVTGSLVGGSLWNVEVSGLALERCTVMEFTGVGEALDVRKWGTATGVGSIASYRIANNKLTQLNITMDAGGYWSIDKISGVERGEFHRWMEAQAVAPDEEEEGGAASERA